MRGVVRRLLVAGLLTILVVGSAACQEEGPAEKVGRKLDETVDKLRHGDEGALEKAGRKLDEAKGEVGEAIEDLGEQIQGSD